MRDAALATLQAIASSPDAVGVSDAHLYAAVDALVAVYVSHDQTGMTPQQIARRSEMASWNNIGAHVECRIKTLKYRAQAAGQ